MSGKPERWDCIFVDRVEPSGRIYLTNPQRFGDMYFSANSDIGTRKVRSSIPKWGCGTLIGSSTEAKFLKAIAISTVFNRQRLKESVGLILSGFIGGKFFATPDTWIVNSPGKGLRVKGNTGWIAYISPNERFYSIINGRYKGNELLDYQVKAIHNCIKYLVTEVTHL